MNGKREAKQPTHWLMTTSLVTAWCALAGCVHCESCGTGASLLRRFGASTWHACSSCVGHTVSSPTAVAWKRRANIRICVSFAGMAATWAWSC